MPGLIDSAGAILRATEQRLAAVSANISNVSTPGYKRQVSFSALLSRGSDDMIGQLVMKLRPDLRQGDLAASGNPLDMAISGDGLFRLRDGDQLVYSRQGQFRLAADGTVVTPQGLVLQQAGGGDLTLDSADVKILTDGTVLDGDRPVARVAVYAAASGGEVETLDGSLFRLDPGDQEEVAEPVIR